MQGLKYLTAPALALSSLLLCPSAVSISETVKLGNTGSLLAACQFFTHCEGTSAMAVSVYTSGCSYDDDAQEYRAHQWDAGCGAQLIGRNSDMANRKTGVFLKLTK